MRPLTEKILKSGLIDRAMVLLLEKSGALPEGAADSVKEDALKNAPMSVLHELADDMAEIMEREHAIKETSLDLKNLKWPVQFNVVRGSGWKTGPYNAMIDQMGRYYVRFQDADEADLVIGATVSRVGASNGILPLVIDEHITECQKLFVDDQPVCFQISTVQEKMIK